MFDYQDYTVCAHIYNFSLTTLCNVFSTRGFKLQKGTEYVRALFMKNVEHPQNVSSNPYSQIINSMGVAREKHLNYQKRHSNNLTKYAKGLAKALLGRV